MNRIKYDLQVKEYIFQNNIWLKTDRFNAEVESSPGNIMMINPRIINRDGYTEEVMLALTQAQSSVALSEQKRIRNC